MTRTATTRLLDFAELCNENSWPTSQARRVFDCALQVAKQRDSLMLDEMKNRLGVENDRNG